MPVWAGGYAAGYAGDDAFSSSKRLPNDLCTKAGHENCRKFVVFTNEKDILISDHQEMQDSGYRRDIVQIQ